jgi:hypothetical protein
MLLLLHMLPLLDMLPLFHMLLLLDIIDTLPLSGVLVGRLLAVTHFASRLGGWWYVGVLAQRLRM